MHVVLTEVARIVRVSPRASTGFSRLPDEAAVNSVIAAKYLRTSASSLRRSNYRQASPHGTWILR